MKKSIKFTLKPKGQSIENVVGKCSNFLKSNGLLDDTVRSQVMVVRELVANCMKYCTFDHPKNRMTVQIHINSNEIIIEVMNPINERNFHKLRELDKTIQWIRGYQDPHEAYMLSLKNACERSNICEANGLGLAKIAYEANATLDFYVSKDNIFCLLAIKSLGNDYRN
jgi:hypothetical protein